MARGRRQERGSRRPKTTAGDERARQKKARREQAKLERLKALRRKRLLRRVRLVGVTVAAVAAAAAVAFLLLRPSEEIKGVERPPYQGRQHLSAGAVGNYGTPTPTSGSHSVSSARCGIFATQTPPELAVHSLEHGVVVVWYRSDLKDDLLPSLSELVRQWDSHVIVSPHSGISDPIVATAWNRLKRYERVDEGLEEFIDVYRRRGPESVRCDL
ncbi:MAG: DUF3105 domain-containing protein [Acidimicrobiia bacterium]